MRSRIVQTNSEQKVDQAKADAFLGWQNQVVDHQTVSKSRRVAQGAHAQARTQAAPNLENSSDQKTPASKSLASKPLALSSLGIVLPQNRHHMTLASNDPAWATPGTRPEDYVEGMAESEQTALNTKEFKFYGYFQRIRERLDRAWVPILKKRLVNYYKSGRRLATDMNYTTKVLVVLNETGEITRVELQSESGTVDLDEAAVGAFNKAGPFPNPPKGMFDKNSEIKIPWDFVLKT